MSCCLEEVPDQNPLLPLGSAAACVQARFAPEDLWGSACRLADRRGLLDTVLPVLGT